MSNGLWVTPADLGADLEASEYALQACESASFILWGMSGRKFSGVYTVTERYLLAERTYDQRYYLAPGVGYSVPAATFLVFANQIKHDVIRLKGSPAQSIDAVYEVLSGDLIDPTAYDLWNHTTVKFHGRIPGDMDITYTYGVLPPTAGMMAARELAKQFALLWSGRDDECSLPSRVTNVTRQGVSWVLLDQQDFIADLRTGIYAVDLFLKTVNPDSARARAKVFSPDISRGRRKTPEI